MECKSSARRGLWMWVHLHCQQRNLLSPLRVSKGGESGCVIKSRGLSNREHRCVSDNQHCVLLAQKAETICVCKDAWPDFTLVLALRCFIQHYAPANQQLPFVRKELKYDRSKEEWWKGYLLQPGWVRSRTGQCGWKVERVFARSARPNHKMMSFASVSDASHTIR